MPKAEKRCKVKEKFPCEVCGVVLSSSYNLRIHLETKCSTIKNFDCGVCSSKFLTQHSLKTHVNSLHFGEKKFLCSFCTSKFLSKGQLKVHERSHTKEKSFVCQVCGKGFSHRESLVTHSTTHTGIKPYICECCSSTFSCVGNLIKHRKVRPNSCGLPIYANKKIWKRAGVKCKGNSTEINLDLEACNADLGNSSKHVKEEIKEEIVYETEIVEMSETFEPQFETNDHQSSRDVQLEDYSKKEMDVFDYIGIEIKNIQEQEEREKLMKMQADASGEEVQESEDHFDDSHEVYEDVVIENLVIEKVYIEPNEAETLTEDKDFQDFVDVVENSSFRCKLCPKIYQKRNITIKHLKSEHQIVLSSYVYDNSNRYRKPQKDLDWKCRFCARKYTSKRLAERHERVHGPNGDLLHKCSCCPLYFQSLIETEAHQYSEHEDRLVCKVESCSRKFDHPDKRLSHTKYSHSNKKPLIKKYNFVCQLCGRNFNTKVALSDHERSDCGKAPIYQCSYCDKNYHSAGSLKCHLTIHTNVLNFPCSFCTKQFRTKGQLTVHLRSHTKEKNYKCSHCSAEFSHRESLLTHNTLHTGIKRFECSSCNSRFSCISNLLSHRKSHKNTCGNSQITKVSDAENSVKMCRNEPTSDK